MDNMRANDAFDVRSGQRADSAGVRMPPPLVFIAMYLLGWSIQSRIPAPFLPDPLAFALGGVLLAGWLALVMTSIPTMIRRGGTLNTAAPTSVLVTAGVYRVTRNPMYLSLVLLYLAIMCLIRMLWPLALLPVALIYTQITILREERYLARAFGSSYLAYKERVRRWL